MCVCGGGGSKMEVLCVNSYFCQIFSLMTTNYLIFGAWVFVELLRSVKQVVLKGVSFRAVHFLKKINTVDITENSASVHISLHLTKYAFSGKLSIVCMCIYIIYVCITYFVYILSISCWYERE